MKEKINSSTWECNDIVGNPPDFEINREKIDYSNSVSFSNDNSTIDENNDDGDFNWYVDDTGDFTKKGSIENIEICGSQVDKDCDQGLDPGQINTGNSNNDGENISWKGEYMKPYFIQGTKYGCEDSNPTTIIKGSDKKPLLIKNLPLNTTAYYINANHDGDYFINDEKLEKVNKKSVIKIEVLISDSLKSEIKDKFDNNRLTFYNESFYSKKEYNDNGPYTVKDDLTKDKDYQIIADFKLDPEETNSICYELVQDYNWGIKLQGGGINSVCTGNTPQYTININWDDAGNLEELGISNTVVREKYCTWQVGCENTSHDYNRRGMSFIFIVHYTDGTCSADENIQVRKAGDNPNGFNTKPVTWRLTEDKVFIGYDSSGINSPGYEITPSGDLKLTYRVYARKENLPYIFGLSNSAEFVASFRKSLSDPWGNYNDQSQKFGIALVNFDTIENKNYVLTVQNSTGMPPKAINCAEGGYENSPVCKMFSRMFVKGMIDKGTYNLSWDYSSPADAVDMGIIIRPPVIAGPTELNKAHCDIKKEKCGNNATNGCESDKVCQSFVLDQMSITGDNTVSTGETELNVGQPLILRFYAWADPAQMPLRRILVKDSDDDAPTVLQADSIGNRKPKCTSYGYCAGGTGTNWDNADDYKYQIPCDDKSDCVFYRDGIKDTAHLVQGVCTSFVANAETPNGFGNDTGRGCRASYYEFYLNIDGTKSSYKPAVQVLDNWGWCSGKCTTAPYSSNDIDYGCYGDGTQDCIPEKNDPNNNIYPWINYNGNVIVN